MRGQYFENLNCPVCHKKYVVACGFLANGGHWVLNYSACIGRYKCNFHGGIVRFDSLKPLLNFVSKPDAEKIDYSIFV